MSIWFVPLSVREYVHLDLFVDTHRLAVIAIAATAALHSTGSLERLNILEFLKRQLKYLVL